MVRERRDLAWQSVADVLGSLRCIGCDARRLDVLLCEGPHGPGVVPEVGVAAGKNGRQ